LALRFLVALAKPAAKTAGAQRWRANGGGGRMAVANNGGGE